MTVSRSNRSVMTYCFLTWSLLTIATNDHVQLAQFRVIEGTLPCRVTYRSSQTSFGYKVQRVKLFSTPFQSQLNALARGLSLILA